MFNIYYIYIFTMKQKQTQIHMNYHCEKTSYCFFFHKSMYTYIYIHTRIYIIIHQQNSNKHHHAEVDIILDVQNYYHVAVISWTCAYSIYSTMTIMGLKSRMLGNKLDRYPPIYIHIYIQHVCIQKHNIQTTYYNQRLSNMAPRIVTVMSLPARLSSAHIIARLYLDLQNLSIYGL